MVRGYKHSVEATILGESQLEHVTVDELIAEIKYAYVCLGGLGEIVQALQVMRIEMVHWLSC